MAIIHASGRVGKAFFTPADDKKGTEAVLNVGVCESRFISGKSKYIWYQACWTGKVAEQKNKIIDKLKDITVTGREDFRIKNTEDKISIERIIWVIDETPHWKDRDQLELNFKDE